MQEEGRFRIEQTIPLVNSLRKTTTNVPLSTLVCTISQMQWGHLLARTPELAQLMSPEEIVQKAGCDAAQAVLLDRQRRSLWQVIMGSRKHGIPVFLRRLYVKWVAVPDMVNVLCTHMTANTVHGELYRSECVFMMHAVAFSITDKPKPSAMVDIALAPEAKRKTQFPEPTPLFTAILQEYHLLLRVIAKLRADYHCGQAGRVREHPLLFTSSLDFYQRCHLALDMKLEERTFPADIAKRPHLHRFFRTFLWTSFFDLTEQRMADQRIVFVPRTEEESEPKRARLSQ